MESLHDLCRRVGYPDPLGALQSMQSVVADSELCYSCHTEAKEAVKRMIECLWQDLPRIFSIYGLLGGEYLSTLSLWPSIADALNCKLTIPQYRAGEVLIMQIVMELVLGHVEVMTRCNVDDSRSATAFNDIRVEESRLTSGRWHDIREVYGFLKVDERNPVNLPP